MDPLTITIVALGAFIFLRKKSKTRSAAPKDNELTLLTVSNSTPPIIKEASGKTATVPSDKVVVLALPSAWRGTPNFQGVIWEEQGNADGPDFMFRRDPDWEGEAYFSVAVRNSYGQQSGDVTVKFA